MYLSNSIRNIQLTLSILKTDTKNFNTWSKNNGLVFNNDKLLSVLFTSKRTVYDRSYLMKSNGKSIKQKPTVKLIVITCLQFNFEWRDNIIPKSVYGVLRILKSFKHFTPFTARKCLAKSLVLPRINTAMLLMTKCQITLLNDYGEFRTVLKDMFLVNMLMLLISLI